MNAFLFLFTFLFTQSASAFKMKLIDSTLELGRGMNSTTAVIVNDSENMIAIEASSRVRIYDENGVENLDTLATNLIIVPGQMIIPPNSEQVLNIRWTGGKDIEAEKAYRLLVEYVSISEDKLKGIEQEEKKAGVVINYRIAKSFYVSPKGAKPNAVLTNVELFKQEDKDMLRLSIDNQGTKHSIFYEMKVRFTGTSEENTGETIDVTFTKDQMGGTVNVLPGTQRTVVVPLPEALGKDLNKFGAQILYANP